MRPAYWIGALALLGGIVGSVALRWGGWIDVTTGVVVGALIGALVYRLTSGRGERG